MGELLDKLAREPESRKGENGRVAVIGGSNDYTGAPALSAKAALRTGSDLVKILTSEESRDVVASFSENFIVESYRGGHFDRTGLSQAYSLADWADAVVIGPGLGRTYGRAVKKFVSRVDVPLVVDADAIKPSLRADASPAVFTPHRSEAEMIRDAFGSPETFARQQHVFVALKGRVDEVFTPSGEHHRVEAGTSGMTVGGTGDTLTGVIASLISQGLELGDASRHGLEVNGRAGELATEKYGNGMTATDLVERIPEVMGV